MEVVVYKIFAWKIFYSKKKHLLSYNISSNFFLLVCRLISTDVLLFFPLNHVKFDNMANQVEHSKEQERGNQGQQKCLTKMQLMLEFFSWTIYTLQHKAQIKIPKGDHKPLNLPTGGGLWMKLAMEKMETPFMMMYTWVVLYEVDQKSDRCITLH